MSKSLAFYLTENNQNANTSSKCNLNKSTGMSFKICLYAICYSIISRSRYWNQNTLHTIVCNASCLNTSNFVIPKSVDICGSSIQVHSNEQMMHQRFQCNSANIKQTLEIAISNSFKQNTGFLVWTDSCCFTCINQESSKDKDLLCHLAVILL